MKKILPHITTVILFVFTALPVKSQNVMFNAYFDSLNVDTKEMRIGEHAKLTLEMRIDTGYDVEFLIPEKLAGGDIEVLHKKIYKESASDGRDIYRGEYTITSFLDVPQVIPPIYAKVNDDTTSYYTNPVNLWVNTVPIDTADLKNIKGTRPVWEAKLTWEEYRDTVYLSFLVVLLLALLVFIIIGIVKNKPIMRIVRVKPPKPSHFTALQKIDEIKSDNTLRGEESVKDYYTRLTDTLREYMHNRYKFNASDMTTAEIIENLLRFNDKEAIKEVKEILEVADLVKFAKMKPSLNEKDRNMLNAIDFVNATKNVEEENLKPVETKVVNERSRTRRYWLVAFIVLISCALIAVAALLIIDLGHMLG